MINESQVGGYVGVINYSEPKGGKFKHVAITVITEESFKKPDGTFQNFTESIKVEAWGVLAELINKNVKVGFLVYAKGPLRSNMYTPSSGGGRRKYYYVLAKKIKILARTGKEAAASVEEFDMVEDVEGELQGIE